MSTTLAIPSPGLGALGGMGLSVAQDDEAPGGSTRLRAQATLVGSAVGATLGYAAITAGAGTGLLLSGTLAIAAAPVAATLSVVYLLQAGTPAQAAAYQQAMEVVGMTSSVGGLLGFTAKAVAGGGYKEAMEFSKGAGLVERLLSIEKVADLASGYEAGSLVLEGGAYVAKRLEESLTPSTAKPADPPTPQQRPAETPRRPARTYDPGVDRDSSGQRRAENAQRERERQQERQQERAAAQKAERAEKPGKGDLQGARDNRGSAERAASKSSRDYDRQLMDSIRNASRR